MVNFYDGEFFLAEEEYRDALLAFKKVYNAGYEDNANINYRIGVCYLSIPGEKAEAIPYLEKATENISKNYREGNIKETNAPYDTYLFLGNAYRIDYQLDKAIESFNKFIEITEDKNSKEIVYARQEIEACKRAKEAIKDPNKLNIENLGGLYNSAFNNYNTVVAYNESGIAYMSEQRFYDAVFYMAIENGRFTNPINITPQIQSDGDQYVTALSYDGDKMLLTKVSSFDADIMISTFESRRWTKAENIGKPINSKWFESHACFSPDGKTIYFSSNRKESIGGMDLFYSIQDEKGNWSEPVNLGDKLNTTLNEETPFMCKDGKTLFFSSQGHTTIGGYDIFYTIKQEDGEWSEPVPLPYPLNTTDDDLFFFPTCEKGESIKGYMSRIEEDGFGSGDIYKVELITKDLATIDEIDKPEDVTVVPVPVKTDTITVIAEEPIEKEEKVAEDISVPEPQKPAVYPDNIPKRQYVIKPVYFRFEKSDITATASQKLDELSKVLLDYSELEILVTGHTDALGSESYNQRLSEARAKQVKTYLTDRGVDPDRITVRGMSENEPVALNRTQDGKDSFNGRKFNRRVEISFTKTVPENIIVELPDVPEDLRIK